MSAPQIEGIVGARHGKGELVVVCGGQGAGKSRCIDELLRKLPPGSRFSTLCWPFDHHKQDITRDLRDGLFVFVEVSSEAALVRFPVKPYRLVRVPSARAAA